MGEVEANKLNLTWKQTASTAACNVHFLDNIFFNKCEIVI